MLIPMKKFIALGALAALLVLPVHPVSARKPVGDRQKVELNHYELNLKERSNKDLPLGKILAVNAPDPYVTKVLYDKGYRGRLCAFSCHFYEGYVSKWTDYTLSLQPYETTCFALAGGCNTTTYPKPDDVVDLVVGGNSYQLRMFDADTYSYYLPLEARKAIALSGNSGVVINTGWDIMRSYEIGGKTSALLASVVNLSDDIDLGQKSLEANQVDEDSPREPTLEDKIEEINGLLLKGLISKDEYEAMRKKVLGL